MRSILIGRKLVKTLWEKRQRSTAKVSDPPVIPPDLDPVARDIVTCVQGYTMTSPERVAALVEAVRYIVRHDIPGDIVECGVWKGGSMMAVAYALQSLQVTDRDLYLFDTYAGMTEPTPLDRSYLGEGADAFMERSRDDAFMRCESTLDEVRTAMRSTGYPMERVHFVRGDVLETIPDAAPAKISLLRLDTDWHASTRHELEHLYDRLSVTGVLIIDDYGHWEGARRALDEFIEARRLRLFLSRIDYTGRLAIKVAP